MQQTLSVCFTSRLRLSMVTLRLSVMVEPNPKAKPVALIAEDSRIQAKVLETRLTEAGYVVQVAHDGAAAVEAVRKRQPDIIISDIEMPRMTGYEFCRTVKHDPALCHIPVILLSTLSEAEDIIKGLDAGADNYVTKPYDLKYLLGRIEALRQTPVAPERENGQGQELSVTLAGQTYRVKSGRQQVLNLLISTFENAVEKNHELHRLNEQLTLAKQKLTEWNQTLESLNQQLQHANQRMSRDLKAAARVQQSLLPAGQLELAGARFAWKYTPCEELAGDFLNYFALDEKHIGVFVVDVSGHGAASALLAVAIGRLLTAHVSASSLLVQPDPVTGRLRITPPAEVARELNRRFPMEAQGGLYFTIAYGVLDLDKMELRSVNGGHPPLVHLPRDGQPHLVPSSGFPIGIVDDAEYDEQVLALRPGDRLYFYSDGVPEAMDAQLVQFTEEKMLAVLGESAGQALGAGVNQLFDAVQTWCQPHGPKDDVSILACEIDPTVT
jgi:sigma-B regulation protein RsbU (phosphoserine phosphatase)